MRDVHACQKLPLSGSSFSSHSHSASKVARSRQTAQQLSKSSLLKTGMLLMASSTLFSTPVKADDHMGGKDLMNGDGQFTPAPADMTLKRHLEDKHWIVVSPNSYTFTEKPEDTIEMQKSTCAEGFFDDGLTYLFKSEGELETVRPRHIHFEVKTLTPEESETCDFRFYSVKKKETSDAVEESADRLRRLQDEDEEGEQCPVSDKITAAPKGPTAEYERIEFSDVALFRLGYFDFLKLNTQNMLMEYEGDKWYRVDLIFDFPEQRASIFVNEKPLKSETFFTQRKDKLSGGNALSIYGLSPDGVSQFRNIRVCNDICDEEAELGLKDLSGAAWTFGLGLTFAATLLSVLA